MNDCELLPVPADWNPIIAAGPQSAFIAVMAGFVFMGIVYILTDEGRRHSGGTLVLFMASFLCLAAGSYMTTLISGEITCLRAWSESMFVSGLMAVGVVAMLSGVAWLLPDHHGQHPATRRFLLASILFIAVMVIELLTTTTARGYILDQPMDHILRGSAAWFLLFAPVIIAAFFARHLPGRTGIALQQRQQTRVTIAATCIFAYVLVTLVTLGIIGDRPADLWKQPAGWVLATSLLIPTIGAAITIAITVWALPSRGTWPSLSPVDKSTEQRTVTESASGLGLPNERATES